ncbi:MAG: hypothetical protein IJ985_08115 [Akkermansia sp.]|nr:hypothetical protein [Akkermansia sp.]MBR1979447.1 hypothetical protein [Akkermansia sp.]
MKMRTVLIAAGLLGTLSLSSCIIQQTVGMFIRDEYPGARPPMVIADVDGKPASQKWLKIDPTMLPPSGHIEGRIRKADDGIPYGLTSEFSNVVVSPYHPYNQLDYTGVKVGAKVWDPYTKKPFYIPRAFTFN